MFSPGFEPPVFSEGATPLLPFLGNPAHSEAKFTPTSHFQRAIQISACKL